MFYSLSHDFFQLTSIVLFDFVFSPRMPRVAITSLKLSPSTNNVNFDLLPRFSLCTTTLLIDGKPYKNK